LCVQPTSSFNLDKKGCESENQKALNEIEEKI
jgi:hypothetical protein